MDSFYRKIYLFKAPHVEPIKIARNSQLPITVEFADYTIPPDASAIAFSNGCYSNIVYKQACTISGNTLTFTPEPGFFAQGKNRLQYEINNGVIPLAIDVNCEISLPDCGASTTPEQVLPYVARAEAAAKSAEDNAEDAEKSKDAAAGSADAAEQSAEDAAGSAEAAERSAADAATSAAAADKSAKEAGESANAADQSAKEAAGSATAAGQSAQEAAGSADDAAESKNAAAESAEAAAQSAQEAAGSAEEAEKSKDAAEQYALRAEDAALRTGKRYIARWDKVNAQLARFGDASGITTDTTKFCFKGSVSSDYNNPFDGIYPWGHRRLCNVDLDVYRALPAGSSITGCVTAWEGEPGFSYDDPAGVWVYTPEFWGDAWEDGTYRWFEVTDRELPDLIYYPESIGGRWHGAVVQITVDGVQKTGFLPVPGMPGKRIAVSTMHSYAKNGGLTLENIFAYDATSILYLVEYGNFDSQLTLGNGVSSLFTEAEDKFLEAAADSVTVTIQASSAGNVIPGAIFDIGTSKGGNQVGAFTVVSKETDSSDPTKAIVTLDRAATVTTDNYWSIHGLVNTKDEQIGSRSGYIGANGQSHAYYRGEVFHGNLWRYILGVYHQATTNHIFVANSEEEADNYDAINTTNHIDSGIEIAASNGYIKSLGFRRAKGMLAIPACTETGGSSSAPVGDYHYNRPGSNTILLAGGRASFGAYAGRFCGNWNATASSSHWYFGGRPFLKTP